MVLLQPQILCPSLTPVWKWNKCIPDSLLDPPSPSVPLIHLWKQWKDIQAEDSLDDGDSGDDAELTACSCATLNDNIQLSLQLQRMMTWWCLKVLDSLPKPWQEG